MDFLNGGTPVRGRACAIFFSLGELFYHLRKELRFTEDRTRFYATELISALECLHNNEIIYR